jgi:shikimate dehydrogenase
MAEYRFGLIGKNIRYSLSPAIFHHFFKNRNIDASYELLDIESNMLNETLTTFRREAHFMGLNVTQPYKEKIGDLLDKQTPEAEAIGAVNCIFKENDRLVGHNTDGIGFWRAYRTHLEKASHLTVLGSGGAARAVLYILTSNSDAPIHLVARNEKKKQKILAELRVDIAEISDHTTIINCTTISWDEFIHQPFAVHLQALQSINVYIDLKYYLAAPVNLTVDAEYDGKSMLVEQASEAALQWLKQPFSASEKKRILEKL